MNIKVVVIWAIFIVLFAGIGIFGFFNQDLILEESEEYQPITETGFEVNSCTSTLEDGISSYTFTIDKGIIQQVTLSYKSTFIEPVTEDVVEGQETPEKTNLPLYEAANNINNFILANDINGVTSAFSGGVNDFVLYLYVNPNAYDKAAMDSINTDLAKLSMVIDSINSYDVYKEAINHISNSYTCINN